MRRHQVIGLAFFALFAFSAILAASASAEVTLSAEWLINGAAITATLAITITGEFLFEDSKALGVKLDILCSAILDDTILTDGESEIAEILTLAGVAVSKTPLSGESLSCENKENCGSAGALVLVYPLNLPWVDLLYQRENGQIWDDVTSPGNAKGPGYETECTVLGTKITDECTSTGGLTQFQVINNTAAELNGTAEPNGLCSVGGAGAGINAVFEAPITVESGTLTVSLGTEGTLLAEWLVGGAAITATLASKTTGEILFEDSKALGVKVDVLCSFIWDGTILTNGESEITEVLTLAGAAVSKTPLTGEGLSCENKENCGATGALVVVFPLHLPWLDLLFLKENGQIWDDVTSPGSSAGPGYETECTVLGTKITDECTSTGGLTQFLVINNTAAELNGTAEPNGLCTQGGAGSGVNQVFEVPITVESGTVTISSE
jgi:hypothetical protein